MHLYIVEDLVYVGISGLMAFVSLSTLWWMLHDWNHLRPTWSDDDPMAFGSESFSLIVPARHEESVLGETLFRLRHLDHPNYEVFVVVGHDDDGTRFVAERAASEWPDRFSVVVDTNWPKNKPKALNTAIGRARGSVVGIFDAEDEVSPEVLRTVELAMRRTGADVVQAGVQLVDLHSRWYSLRNCLEYFFWYRSRMHAHALHGVMPLGGNTVFFRRERIASVGGWDDDCLAEDCDIGIRLSAAGCLTTVVYEPHVATREETPPTLKQLFKQRTRWNQGFLQVLKKSDIGSYPSFRQRLLARYLLCFPFLQAATAVLLPISLVMIATVKLPVGVTLAAFTPLLATVITTVAEIVALRELCRDFYLRLRLRSYLLLVLSTIPYQFILGLAARRAVWRESRGNRAWEKTAHTGSHRTAPSRASETASAA